MHACNFNAIIWDHIIALPNTLTNLYYLFCTCTVFIRIFVVVINVSLAILRLTLQPAKSYPIILYFNFCQQYFYKYIGKFHEGLHQDSNHAGFLYRPSHRDTV